MPKKSENNTDVKRINVSLSESTRQAITQLAEDELRPVAVQAAYFVELGLTAHRNGYRIKNGSLKRFEQTEVV